MPPSIDDARAHVESAVQCLIESADSDEKFAEFESIAWRRLLALGRAVVVLFLARRALAEPAARYTDGGTTWSPAEWRTTDLGTRFGKVGFTRRVGRRPGLFRRGKADLRLDRVLGLCGGFSLGAATALARLCAVATGEVCARFHRDHRDPCAHRWGSAWISTRTTRRVIASGARAGSLPAPG